MTPHILSLRACCAIHRVESSVGMRSIVVLQDLWTSMQPHVDSAAYINYIDKVSHHARGPCCSTYSTSRRCSQVCICAADAGCVCRIWDLHRHLPTMAAMPHAWLL
jgi:hypothetical protein